MTKQKSGKKQNKSSTKEEKEESSAASSTDSALPLPEFDKAPDKVPDEFYKIIKDFTEDIVITFPEYKPIINKWWGTNVSELFPDGGDNGDNGDNCDNGNERQQDKILEDRDSKTEMVFVHCLRVIPERFFDILYKNDSMFEKDSIINTEFLPGIVFKYLWSCDISESTRETIWKYLQLILFSLLNSVKSSKDFGDSAKLFEAINEEELKKKLEDTLSHMQTMFNFNENGATNAGANERGEGGEGASAQPDDGINVDNLPSAESMHEHIQEMMKGNLGKLAMELAEEAAKDLDLDMDDTTSTNDAFQKMFKNPSKLMNIVKNLGSKLDAKIKSGEIKESELISEGMEMLNKMKSMPGMGNMQEMFAKMGMPGMPTGAGKGKVNVNAMESQMQKNFKMAQMKERMRKKAEDNLAQQQAKTAPLLPTPPQKNTNAALTDEQLEQLFTVFSKGEKNEKTPRGAKAPQPATKPVDKPAVKTATQTSINLENIEKIKENPIKRKK